MVPLLGVQISNARQCGLIIFTFIGTSELHTIGSYIRTLLRNVKEYKKAEELLKRESQECEIGYTFDLFIDRYRIFTFVAACPIQTIRRTNIHYSYYCFYVTLSKCITLIW